MSEGNTTFSVKQAGEHNSALIQFFTTLVCLPCAIITLAVYCFLQKWRKHNYLYAKQIIFTCVATFWTFIISLIKPEIDDTEDHFTFKEVLILAYFAFVVMTVAWTVHTVALGHIHVALSYDEIADEEKYVTHSWYYFTNSIAIVLFSVKFVLSLDFQTALSITEVLVSALTTGNLMLLTKTFDGIERKCSLKITFLFFIISLGILSDALLILYGGLVLTGITAGVFNDLLKMACAAVILLKTMLILCSKNAMNWNNCRSSSVEEIEM